LDAVYVIGSASAFGSRIVPSEDVDHAFGMPSGKLKARAGIHSFAHAAENEDEGSLGEEACRKALHDAHAHTENLDWIVAASETHHAYPSLSAILHGRLGLRENCNALDVGSDVDDVGVSFGGDANRLLKGCHGEEISVQEEFTAETRRR